MQSVKDNARVFYRDIITQISLVFKYGNAITTVALLVFVSLAFDWNELVTALFALKFEALFVPVAILSPLILLGVDLFSKNRNRPYKVITSLIWVLIWGFWAFLGTLVTMSMFAGGSPELVPFVDVFFIVGLLNLIYFLYIVSEAVYTWKTR